MSDQLPGVVGFNQGDQAGQPEGSSGQQTQAQPGNQEPDNAPQYVTKQEMAEGIANERKSLQKMIDSQVGLVDKNVSKAIESVNALVEQAKKAGMQFSDDQVQQLRKNAIDDALVSPNNVPAQNASPQQDLGSQPGNAGGEQADQNPEQWAMNQLKNAGVPDTAKELAEWVDNKTNDPETYKRSVDLAIAKYYENIAKRPGSPASVPGAAFRGAGAPADLTAEYTKELLAARGQGSHIGQVIRDKYRKLGLDVDNIGYK